jgi:oligoendopeptidase F
LDTKENFIEFLEINDKEEKISNRLMNYISNKHNENLKEAK